MLFATRTICTELKKQSPSDVKKFIVKCRRQIRYLKNIMEHPDFFRRTDGDSTEKVQLSIARECLKEAKKILEEKEVHYEPTWKERCEKDFNNNIPYISEMQFKCSVYPSGWKTAICTIVDDKVHIEVNGQNIAPPNNLNDKFYVLDKEEFFQKVQSLYICEWREEYDVLKRYGIETEDENKWYLDIAYSNDYETKHYMGKGCYPYNMCDFLKLIRIYEI